MAWTKISKELIIRAMNTDERLRLLVVADGHEPVVAHYWHGHWHISTKIRLYSPEFEPTHYWHFPEINSFLPKFEE